MEKEPRKILSQLSHLLLEEIEFKEKNKNKNKTYHQHELSV